MLKENANSNLISDHKGITLISLIITIIVMLILVRATINIALNGELFKKAKLAVTLTQKEIEREELMGIALGVYDENTLLVNQGKLKEKLEEQNNDFTIPVEQPEDNKLAVKGNKSETLWYIDLNTAEINDFEIENWYVH